MTGTSFLIGFFIFVGSVALGALGYERWLSHVVSARKKVARNHSLRRKPLTSRNELQVWRWLQEVFPEHHVLIKVPFTGFIEPNSRGGDAHWQVLLSTVSFACAVSDHRGAVLGCVDVLDRGEMADRKHAFKRELLSRAGIPYWIIDSQRRPDAALLREKFTGGGAAQAVVKKTPRAAMPRTPATALEQRRLSRVSNNASDLTRAGMTPLHLKSTLKLKALARAFAWRLAGEPPSYRPRSSRRAMGYPTTGISSSTI
ncbi:hypothetical protein [Polaromonas aquatica]|uniref:hypothetical protein n=1 Tax=Polaromonas aquatica TaxID=332657 RepID=UPI003D660491